MAPAPLLLAVMLAGYAAGALAALAARGALGRGLVAGCALVGALAGLLLGAVCLGAGLAPTFTASFLPLTGLALRLDGLSAFFLILIGVVGAAVAVYGFGYTEAYEGRYSLRWLGALLNVLLLSLSVQVMADNALTFLMAWEAMSLSAYLLVLTEHDQPGTVRAANWYIAITHAGFAALVAMFLLLSAGELTTSFAAMRAASLAPQVRDAAFVLALFGFGAKAGVVPLHVWLPMAHPVAPSHVSALMSGVVIKMGVYGLLRVTIDLLGGGPAWWGGLVLGLGTVSALLGVLYALMEHDLKRLLAYHSVENIGIIFIGIGAGLMFQSYGLTTLATLGIVGGLYHTINHACFKGLLFLGAGSVLHATGTRNMEEMGGLIKRMPRTAFFFLVGACAISALPPLNGFASEWLVFQTLLGGSAIPQPEVAVIMPIAVAMLALTSGLAAACFVKAFGITFLAIPRSPEAEHAHEAPRSMQVGMVSLVLLCVGLGLAPFAVVPLLGSSLAGLGGLAPTAVAFTLALPLHVPGTFGQMSAPLLALGLVLLLALVPLVLRVLGADRRLRVADTWGCGRIGQTARMEYTATAFAEPLRRVFAELYRPSRDLSIDFHPASKYFVQSIEYRSEIHPWFERVLYDPLLHGLRGAATRVRRLQGGSVHLYLVYMTLALLVLLTVARWRT
ncbi:MAG TPA: hydrogenase 4 subunit B [Candidatus Rokubacteria bacterium]|nr:MAG: hydrogenase 4 subunit B [Candidatus Rokubacteria bacterium GWF2_70_14]HAM56983.1 hydrogenase 4 subunit B [Candidatus Rokubacteria bacterium]